MSKNSGITKPNKEQLLGTTQVSYGTIETSIDAIFSPMMTSSTEPPVQQDSFSSSIEHLAISTSPYQQEALHLRTAHLREKQRELRPLETKARELEQSHSTAFLFLWDAFSATSVFLSMLWNAESILGCVLTVGATLLAYFAVQLQENNASSGFDYYWNGDLPTVLLSFAVITPLSSSISMAFARREQALKSLAAFRSALYCLYVAHSSWDWAECHKGSGRRGCIENSKDLAATNSPIPSSPSINFLQHSDTLLRQLLILSDSLYHYLTLPTATRARHRVTSKGRLESKTILSYGQALFTLNVHGRMISISHLCEALKYRGLPGNEASRIRQWENVIVQSMQELRMVKEYRTPQALRSFARLFTLLLPPFYATSYAQVAREADSLGLGIALGVMTSVALTGLFECVRQLEDPFVSHVSLDGVDVREELIVLVYQELMVARAAVYPEVGDFQWREDPWRRGESGKDQEENGDNHQSTLSVELDRTSRHKL